MIHSTFSALDEWQIQIKVLYSSKLYYKKHQTVVNSSFSQPKHWVKCRLKVLSPIIMHNCCCCSSKFLSTFHMYYLFFSIILWPSWWLECLGHFISFAEATTKETSHCYLIESKFPFNRGNFLPSSLGNILNVSQVFVTTNRVWFRRIHSENILSSYTVDLLPDRISGRVACMIIIESKNWQVIFVTK